MDRRTRFVVCALAIVIAAAAEPTRGLDCDTEINPIYYETDVRSLIHAVTPSEVARIRGELIEYIWDAPTLPQDLPQVELNVGSPFPELSNIPTVTRVDRLTVSMDDFVSNMYLFLPAHPRRRLVIFHQGHSPSPQAGNGVQIIEYFLSQRIPVLVVHMPLYGPNTGPFSSFFFHNPMFMIEPTSLSPFKYFVEPVVQALNYTQQILRIWRVNMIGISGGGWTTELVAAIDPRIRLSIPVAASLPLYLRRQDDPCIKKGDKGDPEQTHPPLYAIADYLDLYVLGSYGRGRGQLQVFNQFDRCCFAGVRYLTYSGIVKGVVAELRRGAFETFLDSSHPFHQISPHALEQAIIPFLRHRRL